VKKYGLNSFCFIVLELFQEKVNQENNKKLLNLEYFYLKSLLPSYNILTEAGSTFGYKDSEMSGLNMESIYSEQCREVIANLNQENFISKNVSQASLNRNKCEYSKKGFKSKTIIVKELNGTISGEYNSILDIAKAYNCSIKTVYRALKSPSKLLKKN
jgi:group I intron endonuclease